MATATYDETYTDLMRIVEIASSGLRDLGKIQGKNALGSEEELRRLVIGVSKKLLENLPVRQFENDEIENIDSKYSHLLTIAEDLKAFQNNDFEVVG
jgi:hypothetical protein